MIKVMIDQDAKVDSDIAPQWVNDQLNKRRGTGAPVCVRVDIALDRVHLSLATPPCPGAGAIDHPPSSEERKILNDWAKYHLDTDRFATNELVAFLRPFIH